MIAHFPSFNLRPPELKDGRRLYEYKNDPEITSLLGGFSLGYTLSDITDWLETHRKRGDEVIWVIADSSNDDCLGHVGLYNIDHRIRCAEFAIMIGAKDYWGKGLGASITRFVVNWGFNSLNLNRIYLSVLENNERARRLYRSLGFKDEGRLRQAQFKNGAYLDVVLMSLLRSDPQI